MKPLSRQRENVLKSSPAYKVGKSVALTTACQKGHTGFRPSTNDHLEWGNDWTAFMAGWRDGLRDYSKL
ncbi:hypothetical protein ANRL2_03363 [Anaerolineae bacterium]|nr:hypothetical protein ANRL2_03363 [Anaerolineae bacterium]